MECHGIGHCLAWDPAPTAPAAHGTAATLASDEVAAAVLEPCATSTPGARFQTLSSTSSTTAQLVWVAAASATTTVPLIMRPAGEQRNKMMAAMSSGSA
jgi:hypothetical protein